jgi:hypothetical protein
MLLNTQQKKWLHPRKDGLEVGVISGAHACHTMLHGHFGHWCNSENCWCHSIPVLPGSQTPQLVEAQRIKVPLYLVKIPKKTLSFLLRSCTKAPQPIFL